MSKTRFLVTHLYPQEMSIYGDMGNIRAISHVAGRLGCELVYQPVGLGDDLPEQTDFYFMGGGQDKEQLVIFKDLLAKQDRLKSDLAEGVGMLAICGGYQLLGRRFVTGEGVEIPGIGVFPVETRALDSKVSSRCIGNVVVRCDLPDLDGVYLVGFENHSGQTYFESEQESARPLGQVLVGFGNNSVEKIEGCVSGKAVGTYLHGSCLPKNPELTEFFIRQGLSRKGVEVDKVLDHSIALAAKKHLVRVLAGLEI